jgi:hypothetical protein
MIGWFADGSTPTADSLFATADGYIPSPYPTFDVEMVEVALGNVKFYWPNMGWDTYVLQINGAAQPATTALTETIAGLLVDTTYNFQLVGYVGVVPVMQSATKTYRYGSNETQTVTYMKRIRPFPSVGFN